MYKIIIYCLILVAGINSFAQGIVGKVTDGKTGERLPYASVLVNGTETLIANAEGNFSLPEKFSNDSDYFEVLFLGYYNRSMTVVELKKSGYTVKMEAGIYELDEVMITKGMSNADSIMAAVNKNLVKNYTSAGSPAKSMIFYRESELFKPSKLKVEISQSKEFTKEQLKGENAQLKNFADNMMAYPVQEFTDMLCNYYTSAKTIGGKTVSYPKLNVVKAIKLKDKSKATSIDEIEKVAGGIIFKHLDSTKYYRIKSGIFGSRDTIPLRKDKKQKAKEARLTAIDLAKSEIMNFRLRNYLPSATAYDFVNKPGMYEYTFEGATHYEGDEFVYVIKFKPRKRKAKYTGTLYISESDYAVVKAEYTLDKGKTMGGVNLKFLLGVKQSENVSRGTVIFKKNTTGSGYYLYYAASESGQYVYVNRPLRFIELADENKDVVEFEIKAEINILDKNEYLNLSQSAISDAEYENVKEEKFNYLEMARYDSGVWKEFTTIEPLQEMRQFKSGG